MELNKCLGCMEDFRGYPCPKCSYDPQKETGREYALPLQTILAGKYLIGRVLGQGGFGITYIGWDIALERKVAIKEYYPSGQVSRSPGTKVLTWYTSEQAQQAFQNGMEMFLKEARKMVKVDGLPHIVRVLDLFRENDTAYIVMDFVEGETLSVRLKKTGPMSWSSAKEIFIPVMTTMVKVHKAGLIHRDLSPDNLMLTVGNDVKILDLGAAKDLNTNSGVSSMQVAKSGFSPLEQYTQRGGSGPWTDVYALAATIYYSLTGMLPPSAVDRIEDDTLSWNVPGLESLPPAVLDALKKAMAITSKRRTQAMEELLQAISAPVEATVIQPQLGNVRPAPPSGEWKQISPSPKRCIPLAETSLSAGGSHSVGLRTDGTVVAVGSNMSGQCDVSTWRDITMVSAGWRHTLGLFRDGCAVAVGYNSDRQLDVIGWRNIIAISAGDYHSVGLCRNGTVLSAGSNEDGQRNVSGWQGILAISAGGYHTVGLHGNGTVIATGRNWNGQCNVFGWKNIAAISAGVAHTVGLCTDGTVVAAGSISDGQCEVGGWRNIVAISVGDRHTVGLRSDGTVLAVGDNRYGQCEVSRWRNIVAISAGSRHTIGLCADGTVVAAGSNTNGRCDVAAWTNIRTC